jgi:hypothetical protein
MNMWRHNRDQLDVMFSMQSMLRLYKEDEMELLMSWECKTVSAENTVWDTAMGHVRRVSSLWEQNSLNMDAEP